MPTAEWRPSPGIGSSNPKTVYQAPQRKPIFPEFLDQAVGNGCTAEKQTPPAFGLIDIYSHS